MADILILEDNLEFGSILEQGLAAAGHRVRVVEAGKDALACYQADPCDVMVADMIIRQNGAPVPDGGLLAIWRIREAANKAGRPITCIAMSGVVHARGMDCILNTAKNVGADYTLAKPFGIEELLDMIGTHETSAALP